MIHQVGRQFRLQAIERHSDRIDDLVERLLQGFADLLAGDECFPGQPADVIGSPHLADLLFGSGRALPISIRSRSALWRLTRRLKCRRR